jgi:hypothetical protein
MLSRAHILRTLSHLFTKSIAYGNTANKDLYYINDEPKLKWADDVQYRTNKIAYSVESAN